MAVKEPNIVLDGLTDCLGGIDSGRLPSLLGRNQLAFATNVSLRGGFPGTRPRLSEVTLIFDNSEIESWFKTHRMQFADTFYLPNRSLKIASIGGRIFSIDEDMNVLDITPRMDTATDQQFTVPAVDGSVDIVVDNDSKIFIGYPLFIGGSLYRVTVKTPMFSGYTKVLSVGATTVTADHNALAATTGATFTIGDVVKTGDTTAGSPIITNINTSGVALNQTVLGPDILSVTNQTATPLDVIPQNTTVTYLDPNNPNEPFVWMAQDEDYWIIQDGSGRAIIFDGAKSRRASGEEVPTGTAMVFNEEIGRFAVAVNGNEIAIGNIASTNSGPEGVLKFTENQYLAEGGRFKLPRKFGKIIGMKMMINLDRSNGQGAMIVFAKRGITTFNLPANRDSWKDLTYPVQINTPLPSATSQGSIVQVNGDLYYRAPDGLRSLVFAVRDFASPGNVPLSSEMERVFKKDDRALLAYASAVLFDNRVIFTVSPLPSNNGIYHQGLGTLDLDLISRMGAKASPVYEGVWSGVRPTKMLIDDDRCFIFSLNPSSQINELWELHKEVGFDNTDSRVVSSIETGAMNFPGGGQSGAAASKTAKKLSDCEIWVDSVVGKVNFLLQWRPDGYPCWFDWATAEICVAYQDCPVDDECLPLRTFNPGYATRIGFGQPPDSEEFLDFKPARLFYHCQFRLVWTGQARIYPVFLVKAEQVVEPTFQVGGTVIQAPPQLVDERTSSTLRSRIGYVYNETTRDWHLIRANNNPDGVQVMFLEEAGIP